jgi:ATP-dependent Clp protease adaptor protein ClpS
MKPPVGIAHSPLAASTHPGLAPDKHTRTVPALEPSWIVVVMNDDVNLMTYVVHVFRQVFGYETARARQHMLEVHQQGRSVVWSGAREGAEHYVHLLQQWHLRAQLESHA